MWLNTRFAGWDPAHWRYGDALDAVQTGFDVAGLLPGVGAPFDGANALISLARGDPAGAALAAAAMVPVAGMGATSAKLAARYGDEAAEAVDVVAARSLLFSQDTIGWTTKSGIPLDDLSQSIAGGWRGDPLRVIEFGDALVSLDNRRLAAAKLIDAEVPIRRVSLADPEVRKVWKDRDGPRTSVLIRGTNMAIDISGRVHER